MSHTSATPAGPNWRALILVFLGGTLGTLLRYGLSMIIGARDFPVATLLINVTGAAALGFLLPVLPRLTSRLSCSLRWFGCVGLLGGYTTYSLLAAEVASRVLNGQTGTALSYGLATLVLGGFATWVGILLGLRLRPSHA